MKIAITGHSAGIGQALAKQYEQRGHEIVGLSRRNGYNIRSIPKVAGMIEPCDMFINNAQVGFAQTELLYEIWQRWRGVENRHIINISTIMTCQSGPPGEFFDDDVFIQRYQTEKRALEEAHFKLVHQNLWPQMILVKPGEVKTWEGSRDIASDVDLWAETMVNTLDNIDPALKIYELSLGVNYTHGI
jgi:hypothetical protein